MYGAMRAERGRHRRQYSAGASQAPLREGLARLALACAHACAGYVPAFLALGLADMVCGGWVGREGCGDGGGEKDG